jgi:hypothetical protein
MATILTPFIGYWREVRFFNLTSSVSQTVSGMNDEVLKIASANRRIGEPSHRRTVASANRRIGEPSHRRTVASANRRIGEPSSLCRF